MFLTYLFTFIATIFFDVMDTVHFHRDQMIFPKNNYFKIVSSGTGRLFFFQDAWHDSKKLAQLFFVLSQWFAYDSNLLIPEFFIFHLGIQMAIFYATHKMFFHYLFLKKEFR